MNLDLDSTNHSGDLLIRIENASVGYGSEQIHNAFNDELRYRDRVALMGTNGSGKSTLFKLICDELKPVSGVIRLGENVSIGFMQQETASFDGASTPLSYIRLATDISDKKLGIFFTIFSSRPTRYSPLFPSRVTLKNRG